MVDLSKEEQISEVNRLEERALFYLKFFSIFWSTLVFFIVQELNSNPAAKVIVENFFDNFNDLSQFQGVVTTIIFYILLLLITATLPSLIRISVERPLKENTAWAKIITKKYNALMGGLTYGFIASVLLVLFLVYLLLLEIQLFTHLIQVIGNFVVFIILILILLVTPIVSLGMGWRNWGNLKRAGQIFVVLGGIVFFGSYLLLYFYPNCAQSISADYWIVSLFLFIFIFHFNVWRCNSLYQNHFLNWLRKQKGAK